MELLPSLVEAKSETGNDSKCFSVTAKHADRDVPCEPPSWRQSSLCVLIIERWQARGALQAQQKFWDMKHDSLTTQSLPTNIFLRKIQADALLLNTPEWFPFNCTPT